MKLTDELIKEVFILSLSQNPLSLENFSFKVVDNDKYKTILVEQFNRKLPSDFYRMQILDNNDISNSKCGKIQIIRHKLNN